LSSVVKFTEAASLALHSMALLAAERERRFQIHDIADALPGSTSHLAKVLQRLAKVGLITSVRGRGGGFVLARDPAQITMLEVYEAIEGRLDVRGCAFPDPQCSGDCIFGDALGAASRLIRERLAHTRLSELHTVLPAGSAAQSPKRRRPRA
jgi:Rrf2 family protein